MEASRYSYPDTSDKRDDECWIEYWDRKRHERHGPDCRCALCENDWMPADHSSCKHTYCDHEYLVADNVSEGERNDPEGYVYCGKCLRPKDEK